jgi:hypothetical protein
MIPPSPTATAVVDTVPDVLVIHAASGTVNPFFNLESHMVGGVWGGG